MAPQQVLDHLDNQSSARTSIKKADCRTSSVSERSVNYEDVDTDSFDSVVDFHDDKDKDMRMKTRVVNLARPVAPQPPVRQLSARSRSTEKSQSLHKSTASTDGGSVTDVRDDSSIDKGVLKVRLDRRAHLMRGSRPSSTAGSRELHRLTRVRSSRPGSFHGDHLAHDQCKAGTPPLLRRIGSYSSVSTRRWSGSNYSEDMALMFTPPPARRQAPLTLAQELNKPPPPARSSARTRRQSHFVVLTDELPSSRTSSSFSTASSGVYSSSTFTGAPLACSLHDSACRVTSNTTNCTMATPQNSAAEESEIDLPQPASPMFDHDEDQLDCKNSRETAM